MARPDAFVALYERDAEAVLVFLTRRTLDVEVALDLTAETFAQAWRGWSRVRLDSPEEVRGLAGSRSPVASSAIIGGEGTLSVVPCVAWA